MFERIRFPLSRRVLSTGVVALAILAASFAAAVAQQRPRPISFIRDAEIEATIRAYATPLFAAAGLDARAISVHLVNDPSLNAFVANGLNMYLNTGLLMRSEHAGQVIGVIAHETGHIQGAHLVQIRDQMRQSTIPYFLEMLATVGAAAAGARPGNPNDWGGTYGGGGGPTVTERFLLRYSRGMESQADQAGLALLDRTSQSSRGLMEFLDIIADQELLQVGRQDPYVRTHPIARERIESIRAHVERSRFSDAPQRPGFAEAHARMRAKLYGFLDPVRALQRYPASDTSLPARYARAIAHFKRLDFNRAHALIDGLIAERPKDAYLLEAKGQFLVEQGKPEDARVFYARAAAAAPEEPLIVQSLGWTELQSGATRQAIATLERARRLQPEDADTWRLLAQAYGRDGQTGLADYAQAESFSLLGRSTEAVHFAERALRQLAPNSTAAIKAQDIKDINQRRLR
ncbi:MAG: M48 family metalloprotease [Alphaproteobacteria bacterium]|nr:M48 family metalloprotease [Alphaproteobacteria bacterium]